MAKFHHLLGIIILLKCTRYFEAQSPPTAPTPRTKTTRTTLGYHEWEKAKRLKKMQFEYYPNYGYEPYWANGAWVLSTTVDPIILAGGTTTKKPTICGEECSYLLRRIGEVCGRSSNDVRYAPNGCGTMTGFSWMASCSGNPGDDFTHGYFTFKTYCQFLDAQCHSKFYNASRYVLVHVGKCQHLENYFRPLWSGAQPISRMKWFLSSLGSDTD